MDLIYKHTSTMYLKTLTCKSQEFLSNKHLLCLFKSEHSIHIYTRFCCIFYHSHHLWLHHCCWPDHSQNSCHKQLKPVAFSVQESVIISQIFRGQSFFRFLTQCQTKAEIRWRTFCRIRWSENWTWFYYLWCGDIVYP